MTVAINHRYRALTWTISTDVIVYFDIHTFMDQNRHINRNIKGIPPIFATVTKWHNP